MLVSRMGYFFYYRNVFIVNSYFTDKQAFGRKEKKG